MDGVASHREKRRLILVSGRQHSHFVSEYGPWITFRHKIDSLPQLLSGYHVGMSTLLRLKRNIPGVLLVLSFLFFLAAPGYAQTPQRPGWKLVWSDEFNYTGHPDPAKWNYEEGYVRHNELQYYTVNRLENARVEGGNLIIELRKETPASFLPTSINDRWHRYSSASVNTRSTASWTYGRFEIRAKMPRGKGTWPAIWFLSPLRTPNIPGPPQPRRPNGREVQGPYRGPNNGESSQGEIDLMESWGSRPNEIAVHIHGTKVRRLRERFTWMISIVTFMFTRSSGIPTTWTSSWTTQKSSLTKRIRRQVGLSTIPCI